MWWIATQVCFPYLALVSIVDSMHTPPTASQTIMLTRCYWIPFASSPSIPRDSKMEPPTNLFSIFAGLTSAIIDETLGGLCYVLKREGVIGSGPSFTVHLEVDYKKPVPSMSTVICTTTLISQEGRKSWMKAEVRVSPLPLSPFLNLHVCLSNAPLLHDCEDCKLDQALHCAVYSIISLFW